MDCHQFIKVMLLKFKISRLVDRMTNYGDFSRSESEKVRSPQERRKRSICRSPLRIGHSAKRSRAPSEVGTLDPVRLVLKVVPRQTAGVGRIRLTVHDLEGSSGIGRVAEVLVAGDATHARRQDGISGGGARRRSPRGQASEETAAGFLDCVQLPAGDAVLLLDVLARVQRRRATIPRVHHAEAAVEVHLRGDVHLSQTGAITFAETQPQEPIPTGNGR